MVKAETTSRSQKKEKGLPTDLKKLISLSPSLKEDKKTKKALLDALPDLTKEEEKKLRQTLQQELKDFKEIDQKYTQELEDLDNKYLVKIKDLEIVEKRKARVETETKERKEEEKEAEEMIKKLEEL
ncbi:MAG TPA: hypothetical protein ENI70_01900 [Candidatus Peregrinibacteria bacterium]|nr:hypothetical protein [Candidatus Peregrinibacteria bacterium]